MFDDQNSGGHARWTLGSSEWVQMELNLLNLKCLTVESSAPVSSGLPSRWTRPWLFGLLMTSDYRRRPSSWRIERQVSSNSTTPGRATGSSPVNRGTTCSSTSLHWAHRTRSERVNASNSTSRSQARALWHKTSDSSDTSFYNETVTKRGAPPVVAPLLHFMHCTYASAVSSTDSAICFRNW